MKKELLPLVSALVLLVLALLLSACPLPTVSSSSGGTLSVSITNAVNARTLQPSISMSAASYTINGSGPGEATFSMSTTGASVTVQGLAFGAWTVTVNALNSDGTVIGSGNSTVAVHTGQTSTVAVTVVPLSGNGTLSLTVSWTASQVETPSIQASLTPPSGTPMSLSFSVSGNQATYSSSSIPTGYQTLTVVLLDNGVPVMGAVEVARIVAGQATEGTYEFTNVNQPGGSVVVNITPRLADPIPVSITGVPATMSAGTSATAAASVSDGTVGVVYVWYLNGVSIGTGASQTFGSTLAAGYYRVDVTGYSADGTRAGSATASLQLTGSGGTLPLDPSIGVPFVYRSGVGIDRAFFSLVPQGYAVPTGQTFAGYRIYRTTSLTDPNSIPFYKDLPAANFNSQTQSAIHQLGCLETGLQTGQTYYYAASTITDKGIGPRQTFTLTPVMVPIQRVNEIWGTSDTNIYAVGDEGNVLHYDGAGWTRVAFDFIGDLRGVHGTSANDIWISSSVGLMYHFDGAQWTMITSLPWYQGLYGIFAQSVSNVFVGHDAGYFFRWNGTAWETTSVGGGVKTSIAGSSADNIWAVDAALGWVLNWTGSSWSTNYNPIANPFPLFSCAMSDAVTVYAVGSQGGILHYDGTAWAQETSGTTQNLNSVSFGQTNGLYAVGNQGTILNKPGPGSSWTAMQLTPPLTANLRTVWVSPSGTVWIGGDNGVLTHL